MMQQKCMICDNLSSSLGIIQLDRTLYSDLYGRLVMRLQREKDPDSDQAVSTYMLVERHLEDESVREHKVMIRFCPFCGKELA